MQNKLRTICIATIIAAGMLLTIFSNIAFCKMNAPFDTPPIDADTEGVSWGSDLFPTIGHLPHSVYTNLIIGSASGSTLTLQFQNPFTDGSGDDFAICTGPSNLDWGYLADQVEFSFYMDNTFEGSFISQLNTPGTIFTFELPGEHMIANKICIKNLATYQGNWDDTDITYVDAGVAYSVPEPATLLLLGLGAVILKKCS